MSGRLERQDNQEQDDPDGDAYREKVTALDEAEMDRQHGYTSK